MRVALIEPLGQSGPLDIAYNLGLALRGRGLDVTLVSTRRHHTPVAGGGLPLVGLLGGMERAHPRPLRALDYCLSLVGLWRFLQRERFDLLHCQDSLLPHLDALFLAALKACGQRLVFTVQDPDQEAINSAADGLTSRPSLRRLVLRRIYATADHLVALSECGREELVTLFDASAAKVTVIPHGNYVSYLRDGCPDPSEARAGLGIPQDRLVVLFFGAIKPTKGVDRLLRAFAEVRRACPRALLLVAGEPRRGVDATRLLQQAQSQARDGAALFHLGYVPNERVPRYFAAADVVALPYDRVYQSGVAQMAYAFRRPVVASRVGGLAEVVADGRSGLLVPPGDEKALAAALLRLLVDAELRQQMGQYGRQLAEELYSWEVIAERTAAVYGSVLRPTGAAERAEE